MNKALLTFFFSILSFNSFATIELTEELSLSGFGSTSITKSNNATPLIINRSIMNENCLDCDTTFGLQLDYFNDAFKASVQLVKRPQDEWSDPEFEWAYLGYNIGEVEFRGGRLRLPIFLASEYYYVSHAYNYSRPPEELYNSILGITAYNGLNLVWNLELLDKYQLSITPYIGFKETNTVDVSKSIDVNKAFNIDLQVEKLSGINFLLSGENYRWNMSYFTADFNQHFKFANGVEFKVLDDHVELYSLGAEYEFDSLLLTAERQLANLRSTWYVSAAYKIGKFVPYIQYGENKAKVTNVSMFDGKSGQSLVLGGRYDLLYNVSINLEWQSFKTFNNQRGSFVETPVEPDAELYTLMVNFVF